jgi:cell division protease FtsH
MTMRAWLAYVAHFVGASRRRALLAAVTLGGVAVAVILVVAALSTPPITPGRPVVATASERWTLAQLAQHIDAGQVTAVTIGQSTSGSSALLARVGSADYVAISLAAPIGDAAAALVTLGYGDLLTSEARATIEQAGGGDPLRNAVSVLFIVVLVGVLALLLWQQRASLPLLGNRGSFSTIQPATPTLRHRRAVPASAAGGSPSVVPPPGGSSGDVRLDDVAGCAEAKLELAEPIEFLRDPDRFRNLGARVPRGILLYGPPGTGKTMLARAVATESGVPFHHASGSDFVEKYVGVGARRVRDLFRRARKMGKGVIFIDEFDALGKSRGGTNSHEEREQTLNQLLVELDGFSTGEDVVVIAATNRMDVLDEALLRPGRFSRKVHVGLPDVVGRRDILAVHARGKSFSTEVDLDGLARRTYGFSGAQLADLLNEAAIIAARRGAGEISSDDVHAGWLKVAVGTGRRRSMNERERAIIAAHEVGHAICGKVHGDSQRVEEISLFAHGDALGVTVSSQEDNDLPSESDLRARLVALMGGRAAEEMLFEDVTPGAASDFDKATQIAQSMVNRWGMGKDPQAKEDGPSGRGALSFVAAKRDGSLPSELQAAGTRAVAAILDEAYTQARATLADKLELLRRIGAYLVREERIDGDTFEALFEGRLEVSDADTEWRPSTARPRDWLLIGHDPAPGSAAPAG